MPSEQRLSLVLDHELIMSHQDNEWTLGPRREPCGANTTVELVNKEGNVGAKIVFEWYWRNDEDEVGHPDCASNPVFRLP